MCEVPLCKRKENMEMLLTKTVYLYTVIRHIEGTDRDFVDPNAFSVKKDWAIDKAKEYNEKYPEYAGIYPIIGIAQVKVAVNKVENLKNICKEEDVR